MTSDLLNGFPHLRVKQSFDLRPAQALSATMSFRDSGSVVKVSGANAPRRGSYVVHGGELWKVHKATPSDDWFSDEVTVTLRQEEPFDRKIAWLEDEYLRRTASDPTAFSKN